MQPWETLDKTTLSDGGEMLLNRRGKEYAIIINGAGLMSSRNEVSAIELSRLGCKGLKNPNPRVLIGGLGMGHTLRAALDVLPETAEVTVAELVPKVLEWNQHTLGHLAGNPLDDPRSRVHLGDVDELLKPGADWDAVLLDVDNGPDALTWESNDKLYSLAGIKRAKKALRHPGGVLAVWSAAEDKKFEQRMRQAGFSDATTHKVRSRAAHHAVFLGRAR